MTTSPHAALRPFRPAPDFELGIGGGPVLPAGIVGSDPIDEPLRDEPSRYCLVWSPVAPSGQKVALAVVLSGLLGRVDVIATGRGRLEPGRDAGADVHWSPELNASDQRTVDIGTSVRSPTLIDLASGQVVTNDPYLLPYALRDLAERLGVARPGNGPACLAIDADPAAEYAWDARIFEDFHVAAYRAGFVPTQALYDECAGQVYQFLHDLEAHLQRSEFLLGRQLGLPDLWLFTLLIRFDQVYGPGFRLHRYRIRDFPAIWRYLRGLYAIRVCAVTTDFPTISKGYFLGIPALNRNVVPAGPDDLYLSGQGAC